tara:strand:- start:2369 stop:2551 length:183 start_codon:yes stop_codon:yes gene_type:complete
MAKKKKYSAREDPDWDEEEAKIHRQIIRAKEIAIKNKYKNHWDTDTKNWRKGFNHGDATD